MASPVARAWRLLVVDDDPTFLDAARRLLGQHARLTIVAVGASGEEALRLARQANPDAVLLDVRMPAMDGFETAERLRAEHAGLRVVLTSTDDQRQYQRLAAAAGAAYLPKREWSPDALLALLETPA
jgi:DNA-binding NarL/FixJ family response regulator